MSPLLIGLCVYAVALAVLGPRLMRTLRDRQREAPRLGLLLWTMLTSSWVVSVISIGLAATAQLSGGLGVAALLRACLRALLMIVGVHDPADAPAAIALGGSVFAILRLCFVAVRHAWRTHRHRSRHRSAVCASSGSLLRQGRCVTVVEAAEAAAYCIPGPDPAIVLTTGALRRLSRSELDAVLAHEIGHLRGRHHLMMALAAVLAQAYPYVPLLAAAPRAVERLVEWDADDRAGHQHGNRIVARALAVMATGPRESGRVPDGALNAAGFGVVQRVERLLHCPRTTAGAARWRITAAMALPALALVAAAAVLIPAVTADPTPLCSISAGVNGLSS